MNISGHNKSMYARAVIWVMTTLLATATLIVRQIYVGILRAIATPSLLALPT